MATPFQSDAHKLRHDISGLVSGLRTLVEVLSLDTVPIERAANIATLSRDKGQKILAEIDLALSERSNPYRGQYE